MTLDIVLPVRTVLWGRTGELDRVKRGLLPSLVKAGYPGSVTTFHVVTPRADAAEVAAELARFPQFDFDLQTDEDLILEMGFQEADWNDIPGWFKQQLIKLAVTARSRAEVALILDADVVAIRALSPSEFEGALPYQTMGHLKFQGWFEASAKALGFEFESFTQAELNGAMGVTPEFLSTEVVRGLLRRLEARSQGRWGPHLMRHRIDYDRTWTEFSLYWLWYLRCEARDAIYKGARLYRFFDDPASLADESQSPPPLFYVLQSTKLTVGDCEAVYSRFEGG